MSSIEKITVNGVSYDVGGTKMDEVYPVGSIYMSVKDVDPGELFGGTWVRIQDTFLLAAGSSYSAGSTGGAATVTLTTSQIPSHTHSLPSHNHSLPSHTHTLASHTHSISLTTSSDGEHYHNVTYSDNNTVGGSSRRIAERNQLQSDLSNSVRTTDDGSHTHTVSGNTGYTTPTLSSTSGTSGSTSGTSDATGGGSSHNNMPPYLAVYMWQRTA